MEVGFVDEYRRMRYDLYVRWQRWTEGHETLVRFGAAFLMAVVTAALAQVTLVTPLTPVPFTLQVLGIALTGGLLGRRWGALSALMYVGMGVVGLPVFAGELAKFQGDWDLFRFSLFTTGLSAWYLVGFIVQAYIVGAVSDNRSRERNDTLVYFAPIAVGGLLAFTLLDVYALNSLLYKTSAFPNAWFALLVGGLLLVVVSTAWLALTHQARRERLELFFGNVVGLLTLYAIGAAGFAFVWNQLGYGALGVEKLLAYAVLPFIPVDLAKILLAVGLLTLVRPTGAEVEARRTGSV